MQYTCMEKLGLYLASTWVPAQVNIGVKTAVVSAITVNFQAVLAWIQPFSSRSVDETGRPIPI